MNGKFLVKALSALALIGILVLGAGFFLNSGSASGINGKDQPAPEMRTNPAPVEEEDTRFEQMEAVLNQSATGRQLLTLKETYRVGVQFETGCGSRFRQNSNLILLDANHDPIKAALFFAHEMHHAQTLHEGNKADLKSESRQTYVNLKLREEAEGMVASIQVKMELEKTGLQAANVTLPLEDHYRQAYQATVGQARLSEASLSERQLEATGRTAGQQALYEAFASGEVKTSNTYEPYPEYYGRDWDEAHPIKALVAGLFAS